MKKGFLYVAMFSALLMGACSQNGKNCATGAACGNDNDKVYTGLLPAADAAGVRYVLRLDYDDDHGYTSGDYDLVEVYVQNDSTKASGFRDAASFKSEGDFTVISGQGADSNKKYLKLVKDNRDSSAGSVDGPLYFLVDSDSTLVMVNDQLQPSETPGLNYTLILVK